MSKSLSRLIFKFFAILVISSFYGVIRSFDGILDGNDVFRSDFTWAKLSCLR